MSQQDDHENNLAKRFPLSSEFLVWRLQFALVHNGLVIVSRPYSYPLNTLIKECCFIQEFFGLQMGHLAKILKR
jgi:hypothetical protein